MVGMVSPNLELYPMKTVASTHTRITLELSLQRSQRTLDGPYLA
jgi:hypothetical protein